jgi:hypothetical protein
MAGKSVAVTGEVNVTEGTMPFKGADSGSWEADPVTEEPCNRLTIGGKTVIRGASCLFRFTGKASGATVTGSETVTLTPGATALRGEQSSVLRHGDSKTGHYGNKLEVNTNNKLSSA